MGIISKLQPDAVNLAVSVSDLLLRQVKLVTSKLNLRKIERWTLVVGIGGVVGGFGIGKAGVFLYLASQGYGGTAVSVFGWSIFAISANLLIYTVPFWAALRVIKVWPSAVVPAFLAALFTASFIAFGVPGLLNLSTHREVAYLRVNDAVRRLPALKDIHSAAIQGMLLSASGGFCPFDCAAMLLSRRFTHVTNLGDVPQEPSLDAVLSNPTPSMGASLGNANSCTETPRFLKEYVDSYPYRREGDCIQQVPVSHISDDIVVFETLHEDNRKNINRVDRLYVGVRNQNVNAPQYDWSIVTEVWYSRVPTIFLIGVRNDGLGFTLFDKYSTIAGDISELHSYIWSFVRAPSSPLSPDIVISDADRKSLAAYMLQGDRSLDARTYKDLREFLSDHPESRPLFAERFRRFCNDAVCGSKPSEIQEIGSLIRILSDDAGFAREVASIVMEHKGMKPDTVLTYLESLPSDVLSPYASEILALYDDESFNPKRVNRDVPKAARWNMVIGKLGSVAVPRLVKDFGVTTLEVPHPSWSVGGALNNDPYPGAAIAAGLCVAGDRAGGEALLKYLRSMPKPRYPSAYVYTLARLGMVDDAKRVRKNLMASAPPYEKWSTLTRVNELPWGFSFSGSEIRCMDKVLTDAEIGSVPVSACRFSGPDLDGDPQADRRSCEEPM